MLKARKMTMLLLIAVSIGRFEPFTIACKGGDRVAVGQAYSGREKPRLIVQLGHGGAVRSAVFSADGKYILTGSNDGTALLWEVQSAKQVRRFGHSYSIDPVTSVAFSSDGKYVLTGSSFYARVFDIKGGKEVRRFEGHSAIFSPNGKYVLAGNSEYTAALLWDVMSGKPIRRFEGNTGYPSIFSPDGKYALTISSDVTEDNNEALLWDVESGKQVKRFEGHSQVVTSVAFSPDGNYILTSSFDATVRLWDVQSGKQVRRFEGLVGEVTAAVFSPDGKYVLTSGNSTSLLWDVQSGKEVSRLEGNPAIFAPDSKHVLTVSRDHTPRLWDIESGKQVRRFEGHSQGVTSVAFSPDGNYILTASFDAIAMVRLSDVQSGKQVRRFEGLAREVTAAVFSPDGKYVLTASWDHTARLWDVQSGKQVRRFEGHSQGVTSVAFSPDGNYILTASFDHTVRLWDVQSGKQVRRFDLVTSANFSPDGKYVLTGSHDETRRSDEIALLWHLESGKQVRRFEGHSYEVVSTAFSPDGKYALTGTWDHTALLWDIESGQEVRRFEGHPAIFSPDGKYVLTSGKRITSLDATSRLWDVETGKQVRRFQGHSGRVNSAAFSPDGKYALTGSSDQTVLLWDVKSGKQLKRFEGHSHYVDCVAFSRDGKYVLTASWDHTARLWDILSGTELCQLISFQDGTWVVVDSEGRFDSSNLEEIAGLQWIVSDDPMRPLAAEIFMRDYYQPRLLTRLLDNVPDSEQFKPVRPLAELNRLQPKIEKVTVTAQANDLALATVKVEVSSAEGQCYKDGKHVSCESGVYDLRLYRDGQLVGQKPSVSLINTGSDIGKRQQQEQLEAWRRATLVKDDEGRAITVATGRREITFSNIRLPQRVGVKRVEFTAYAFNEDRIKSASATPYRYELGPPQKPAPRRAYVITVGVNANQSGWNLRLASKSAEDMRQVLKDRLSIQYDVVCVQLLSTLKPDQPGIALKQATKANIRAVLNLLAGHEDRVSSAERKEVDPDNSLQAATPDDLVVLFISSHGYADPRGNFYVIPYDTGRPTGITEEMLNKHLTRPEEDSGRGEAVRAFLGSSISSDDLAQWWKDVDAGEMVMILDSCHSAAVPGREFRPGPLGDAGFGQLSYDKGMRILTATQPDKTALATLRYGINRSLLSDALISIAAANHQLTLDEWLKQAEKRVPEQYQRLFPEVRKEDTQLPLLLDFTVKRQSTALNR